MVAVAQVELREQVVCLGRRDARADVGGGQDLLAAGDGQKGGEQRILSVLVLVLLQYESGEGLKVHGGRALNAERLAEPFKRDVLIIGCELKVHRFDSGGELEPIEQAVARLVEMGEDLADLLVLLGRDLGLSAR
eukprot:scaffold18815_cov116-Isochrysis_galbana.AAC.2